MEKYKPFIQEINNAIEKFNGHLQNKYHLQKFNTEDFQNDRLYANLTNSTWEDLRFPNGENGGVYFICGYNEKDNNEIGVYIGKASLSSRIGDRLYSHLSKYRNSENYLMYNGREKTYVLELIGSVSLDEQEIKFMAPSLEEFIIGELKARKINLLNVYGN